MRGVPYVLRFMGSGVRAPKHLVPGTDLAGVVESVGKSVTKFRPDDEVFGQSLLANLWRNGGAFAEYAAVPGTMLALKPAGLTFEQAAAVPTSGSLAVQHVRDEGRVQPGQTVLINGAGGAVGSFAVQIAKAYGANVTGVDATGKLEMLRSIGADQVLDYTREDFTRRDERYDLVLDIAGNHPWSEMPTGAHTGRDVRAQWVRPIRSVGPSMVREPGSVREAARDLTVRESSASLPRRQGSRRSPRPS